MPGLKCVGDVYLGPLDAAGASLGFYPIGNATLFSITEGGTTQSRTSKGKTTFGQALDVIVNKTVANYALNIDNLQRMNLAMALMGADAAFLQAAQVDTGVQVSAILDRWLFVGFKGCTTITAKIGAVDMVIDENIFLDLETGMVKIIAGGTADASPGDTVDLVVNAPEQGGYELEGGRIPETHCAIFINGRNQANQHDVHVLAYDALMIPTSAVDFLSDDFVNVGFGGPLKTPEGYDHPYKVTDVLLA
ncbi:MAG: hypothetical protein GY869_25235 [Planctomycetes bacterium]|nr:hypothetical protein [Planctomycetota bacterium]